MAEIPTLSDEQIRARVGDQSFQRGRRYANSGYIFDAARQGMTLKARCQGSQAAYYRLSVTFDQQGGIASADCSCPVGDGGYCKHIAALLLTWSAQPDSFTALEDVEALLNRRTKAELITLVKQMLLREPDLEMLVQTPLPASRRKGPIDPDIYYRHALAAFRRGGDEWGAEGEIAAALETILAIGDGFAAQGDYAAAAAVYAKVATAVAERRSSYGDEEGELGAVVERCVEGLRVVLTAEPAEDVGDQPDRVMVLRALFAIFSCDVEIGGTGFGDSAEELLLSTITDEERPMVAEWTRQAIANVATGDQWSRDYERKAFGGLLLELEMQTLDDEAYLRLCREMGRTEDLIERLLMLHRVDEAVEELRGVGERNLLGLRLADLFDRHGQGAAIERVMLERSKKTDDISILHWLKDRYVARGDHTAALELARTLFRRQPSLELYREIRALAQQRDRWEALRPTLRMQLNESTYQTLLIQIYLDEGEVDHALEALKKQPNLLKPAWASYTYYTAGQSLALEVARAAAATRPREALEIYQAFAEGLIALQGRHNYQQACELLRKVRELYERLGDGAAWSSYVTGLREQNRRLRALMQEMDLAGL